MEDNRKKHINNIIQSTEYYCVTVIGSSFPTPERVIE